MIQVGDFTIDLSDPITLLILAGSALVLLFAVLLVLAVRAAGRSARAAEPLAHQIVQLGEGLRLLGESQHMLKGGLESLTKNQTQSLTTVEQRLSFVQQQVQEKLHETANRNAHAMTELHGQMKESLAASSKQSSISLTQLQERLATIDKAQTNIEKLSGDVLSLQDILSNKQTRGAFGEIQLNDIVQKALPADSYQMQATLSNGKRADCLIHLPNPPGPIVIDAKFPLDGYERLVAADTKEAAARALQGLRVDVRAHIRAISEKYLIEGETADGALMFVPSEAVYAELHSKLADVVREGFAARVWIVSPTTCMATLNTMRAVLKDARMKEQAGAIRAELGLLGKDLDRLETRVGKLDTHFSQASKDIEDIKISAGKAGNRARRLDAFDFDTLEPDGNDVARIAGKE